MNYGLMSSQTFFQHHQSEVHSQSIGILQCCFKMAWPILPLNCWLSCKSLYLNTALHSRWLEFHGITKEKYSKKYRFD